MDDQFSIKPFQLKARLPNSTKPLENSHNHEYTDRQKHSNKQWDMENSNRLRSLLNTLKFLFEH